MFVKRKQSAIEPLIEAPETNGVHEVSVRRWREGTIDHTTDHVAEEVPVAFIYHGVPHAVMLASPNDFEDLAVGFTLSEGIVDGADEIRAVRHTELDDGSHQVHLTIAAEHFTALLRRERNLTGRTGCGLCGSSRVEDAIREPGRVPAGSNVTITQLHAALHDVRRHQRINSLTGSVHAAAFVRDHIELVREDVGRHNALDKVIGALIRAGRRDFSDGYFLITSRASYEMVQKVATVGGALLVAVSAPTAFAVRLAEQAGMTLVGFARENQHVIYSHAHRVLP